MLKAMLVTLLAAVLMLPAIAVPADAGPADAASDGDYRYIDVDKSCDKATRLCQIPFETLVDIAEANMMLDRQTRQAMVILQRQAGEIERQRKEIAHLKDIKGCAKLEVLPQRKTSYRSM